MKKRRKKPVERLRKAENRFPYLSAGLLAAIAAGCIFAGGGAGEINLAGAGLPPGTASFFGTDAMGRDLFSMIWAGGRVSLFIGLAATAISTAAAILWGCAAGIAGKRADDLLMRFAEILMSIPQVMLVIFLQAICGEPSAFSIALVIGMTGWMAVAKVVRSEVRQMQKADYVLAARMMGGRFFYILCRHFLPNFWPAILFMVVTNLGSAVALEATLSFLGVGLPVSAVSWGSLLALSQRALLSGMWWVLVVPGLFLVATLICITNIGEYFRLVNHRERLI